MNAPRLWKECLTGIGKGATVFVAALPMKFTVTLLTFIFLTKAPFLPLSQSLFSLCSMHLLRIRIETKCRPTTPLISTDLLLPRPVISYIPVCPIGLISIFLPPVTFYTPLCTIRLQVSSPISYHFSIMRLQFFTLFSCLFIHFCQYNGTQLSPPFVLVRQAHLLFYSRHALSSGIFPFLGVSRAAAKNVNFTNRLPNEKPS